MTCRAFKSILIIHAKRFLSIYGHQYVSYSIDQKRNRRLLLSIALLTFYSSSLIAFPFARNLLRRIGNNYQLALKNQDGIFKLMT